MSFINIVGVNLCELPFEWYIHVIVQCHVDVQLCNVNIVWSFYSMKSQILNQVHANHFRKKIVSASGTAIFPFLSFILPSLFLFFSLFLCPPFLTDSLVDFLSMFLFLASLCALSGN